MRFVQTLTLVALLGIAELASATRAVASATIVVPAVVAEALTSGSPSVSIAIVRDGANEHVTVAFN